ncbi:MAG: ABC transporter ATP-binding protein [Armatimonadetes bacterium]|nr:ABC transporter ATP-binding protein [Armatimonadota bacterium]MDW8121151.1 ABC transporter ATP-binding protein [Armatimonadota bacterium]
MFRNLTFQCQTGQCLVVTGPNGSGKTTLLKILVGLLTPTTGKVEWGHDKNRVAPRYFHRWIGAVLPDAEPYGELTALENIRLAADLKDVNWKEGVETAGRFGLEPFLQQPLREFSSGMKMRLRLAIALMGNPKAIILDEPFAPMDASGRQMIQQVIEEQKKQGLIIFATNDPRDLASATDILELVPKSLGNRPKRPSI